MANVKGKSPEEIMKEIEKLKRDYEKAEIELKESRRASVTEAVRKAGVEFTEKFNIYLAKRKTVHTKQEQVDKLKADIQSDLQYLKDQYKFMVDTLVGEGAKQEYLVDILGEPPTVKAAAVPGAGTGKKRTKWVFPDGSTMSSVELSKKYNIPIHEGANQRLFVEAAIAAREDLKALNVKLVTGTD